MTWHEKDSGTFRDIKCPFFDNHAATMIRCEGIMDDCMHIMAFKDAEGKRFFMRTYCMDHYAKCEYYRMLMQEKYPEDTERG